MWITLLGFVRSYGDVASLDYEEEKVDFERPDSDSVDFLVIETDREELKGLVMSHCEHHRANPIAVFVTDSRFDASVDRSMLFGDQLIWIFLPITVELKSVVKPCRLERIGRVTPVVLEEIERKTKAFLLSEEVKSNERVGREFDSVRQVAENALTTLNMKAGCG